MGYKYQEAVDAFKQAIEINPDDAKLHYFIGNVYILLNDKDSALKKYEILKYLDTQLANELFQKIIKCS